MPELSGHLVTPGGVLRGSIELCFQELLTAIFMAEVAETSWTEWLVSASLPVRTPDTV